MTQTFRFAFVLALAGCGPFHTPISCPEGFGDCDGDPSNGCETRVDESDCCGESCAVGQICNGGRHICQ